jgi:two-component system cell cycle sensor histidine kinase/response regulator CckA
MMAPERKSGNEPAVVSSIKAYATRLTSPPPRALRILVVDDEEAVRKFVERVLIDAGHEVATAADGPDAIVAAQSLQPLDLLLTDLMMPEMNGDELARRLRREEPELKVLYLTGYSDKLFKERGALWEDESFLDKPCSVKGLLEAIALLTRGRIDG